MTGIFNDRVVTFTVPQVASPSAVAANTTTTQAFTVPGLKTTDVILEVAKPTNQAGLFIVGGRVSAANTLQLLFGNCSTTSITPTSSEIYTAVAYRADRKTQVSSVQFN